MANLKIVSFNYFSQDIKGKVQKKEKIFLQMLVLPLHVRMS